MRTRTITSLRGLPALVRRGGISAAVGTLAVVTGAGVAFAYWSASGSGTATVSATTAQALTVSAVATPLADLYPGKVDPLSFTVSNPNPYPVSMTTLVSASATSSDTTACPSSNISLGAPGALATPIAVAAGSSATGTLPSFVTLSTAAPNGCQGKSFTISLSLSGSQAP